MKATDLVWVVVVIGIQCLSWTLGNTEVIPERVEVYYVNKKYLSSVSAIVKRYSRRSAYYFNVEGTSLVGAGNNVTVKGVYYEFLHNEYKRGFVEIELKMCDVVNKSPWKEIIGYSLIAHGFVCPLPPGTFKVHNISASLEKVPYVMPFEKVMVDGHAKFTATEEIIVRARIYVSFKQDLPRGK